MLSRKQKTFFWQNTHTHTHTCAHMHTHTHLGRLQVGSLRHSSGLFSDGLFGVLVRRGKPPEHAALLAALVLLLLRIVLSTVVCVRVVLLVVGGFSVGALVTAIVRLQSGVLEGVLDVVQHAGEASLSLLPLVLIDVLLREEIRRFVRLPVGRLAVGGRVGDKTQQEKDEGKSPHLLRHGALLFEVCFLSAGSFFSLKSMHKALLFLLLLWYMAEGLCCL